MESAVEFDGAARIHVGLTVSDLAPAIAFYETLFGAKPTKVRPGYAKFEVDTPNVNLALNEDADAVRPLAAHTHFGIQVKSTQRVVDALRGFEDKKLDTLVEEQTTCCHAVQNKIWVRDPDGHPWEIFVVTQADAPEAVSVPSPNEEDACCAPTSCS